MESPQRLQTLAAEVQDAVASYTSNGSIESYKHLQSKIVHLQTAASTPPDTLFRFRLQVIENIAITMLLELGVFDALIEASHSTATADELAKATGYNKMIISKPTHRHTFSSCQMLISASTPHAHPMRSILL